jgi:hypothetical protein
MELYKISCDIRSGIGCNNLANLHVIPKVLSGIIKKQLSCIRKRATWVKQQAVTISARFIVTVKILSGISQKL